jgi:hypothetical protein
LLEAVGFVGHGCFVRETGHTGGQFATVPFGMFGFSHRDTDHLQFGVREFIFVQLQLSQPFAAEYSTKMSQESEKGWSIGP